MANYVMYRNTTLGHALQKTLDDFVHEQQIPSALAEKFMATFDKSFNKVISAKPKNKVTFRADKLRAYRYCDNVWTFLVEQVDFKEVFDNRKIGRVKIVACDGSNKALTTM
ncbi:hypothetical protein WR25_01725 [Diploscapter pachys]|uniref:Transcription initiation factor IIA subunit 2 n=1 Tax=Diploscapter pachys TaxID=2018661 RepID=A0A2A2LSC1_9BILA|nr:hypothetical protein WR25_01725 [Diploscapter pachys]